MMKHRRPTTASTSRNAGFTLLELLLVCGVLAALSAVMWPNVIGWMEADRLGRSVDDLRGLLVGLRVRAMEEGRQYVFSFQPGTGNYMIACVGGTTADEQAMVPPGNTMVGGKEANADEAFVRFDSGRLVGSHALEEGIVFAIDPTTGQRPIGGSFQVSAADATGENWTAIEFRPDGTTADAQFELVDATQMGVTITLRGLTGMVKVSPATRSNAAAAPTSSGTMSRRLP